MIAALAVADSLTAELWGGGAAARLRDRPDPGRQGRGPRDRGALARAGRARPGRLLAKELPALEVALLLAAFLAGPPSRCGSCSPAGRSAPASCGLIAGIAVYDALVVAASGGGALSRSPFAWPPSRPPSPSRPRSRGPDAEDRRPVRGGAHAGPAPWAPRLKLFADGGAMVPLGGVTPAVTATVQSTYLTGLPPSGHGRWATAGCSGTRWRCARGSSRTGSCRPRRCGRREDPAHPSRPRTSRGGSRCTRRRTSRGRHGRCTWPTGARSPTATRSRVTCATASRPSWAVPAVPLLGSRRVDRATRWLAEAAKRVEARFGPDSLVYLPHLDYGLQRSGPAGIGSELAEIDAVAEDLIDFYESAALA